MACKQQKCSLVSTFIIPSLESISTTLASCKISRFQLVSVAEHTSLSLTWTQILKKGSEVIKLFSYSTQLSTKFILLINVKMPTTVGILTFISMINTTSKRLKARNFFICRYFSFFEQLKFRAQLIWAWKKFYSLEARFSRARPISPSVPSSQISAM